MSLVHLSSDQDVVPSSAAGVSITPSATPWAWSSWVEVIASAAGDLVLTGVTLDTTASNVPFIIEVGVGAASSETPIAALAGYVGHSSFGWCQLILPVPIPIDLIPTGSRVAFRVSKGGTSTAAMRARMNYLTKPVTGSVPVTAKPLKVKLVDITAPGVAWGNSAFVDIFASAPGQVALVSFTQGRNLTHTWGEIDFAVGAAGVETVIHSQSWLVDSQFFGSSNVPNRIWPANVATSAGTRLSARIRVASTVTDTSNIYVGYYEDLEPSVVSAVCTTLAGKVTTPAANPVTLTQVTGPPYTWTEMIPLTTTPIAIVGYTFNRGNAQAGEIILGTGSAGNEVELDRCYQRLVSGAHSFHLPYSIPVPAGVRVSAAFESFNGSHPDLKLVYIEQPTHQQIAAATHSIVTVSVPVNTTPWANGSSATVSDGTSEAIPWAIVGFGSDGHELGHYEFDVIVDGGQTFTFGSYTNGQRLRHMLPTPIYVPAGTAVSVVWRKSGTNGTAVSLDVIRYDGDTVGPAAATFTLPAAQAGQELVIGRVRIPSEGVYWSGIAFSDRIDDGRYHEPRILSFGSLVEASSDRRGRLQNTDTSIVGQDKVDDVDTPKLRTWLDRAGLTLRNREVFVELNSDRGIIRGDTWHTLFRGALHRWSGLSRFGFRLEAKNWLQRVLRELVLTVKVGAEFPLAPSTTRTRKVPLLLGRCSDEGSATAPPTVIADADGPGSTGGAFPLAGFRTMGALTVATGLAMADEGTGADFQSGDQPAFMAVVEYAGNALSDPDDAGGGSVANITGTVHTVSTTGANVRVTADALPGGAVAMRFYIGSVIGGAFQWSHYIRTTDPVTGVLFTQCSGLGTHVPGTASVKTAAGVWATSNSAQFVVLAVMADGRTQVSTAIPFAGVSGYDRHRSFAWDPVASALYYEVYVRGAGTTAFGWMYVVPTTQVNSASKPYFLWEWDYAAGTEVDDVPSPQGVIEPVYIGTYQDQVAGNTWGGFLISGRPGEEFENAYLDGVQIPSSEYGVNISAPGTTDYATLFNADPYYLSATGLKCFVVFLRGPYLDAALGLNGVTQARFGINAKGADDDGDITGTFTDDLIDVFAQYLDNGPLADTNALVSATAFVSVPPTFSDGSYRRNLTSWTQAHVDGATVITAGMAGGIWVAGDETHEDLIAQFLMSIAGPAAVLTLQKEGPVRLDITNPAAAVATTILETGETERDSFTFTDDTQGYATRVGYRFAPRYDAAGSRTLTEVGEAVDTHAEGTTGNDESVPDTEPLELVGRWSAGAARQIALAALADSAYLVRSANLQSALHWVHLNGGTLAAITHSEGTGASGWSQRKVQIRGIAVSVNGTRTRLTVRDLRRTVGQLSAFQVGYYMGNQPLGGSRHDSCLTDPDIGVASPPNRQVATLNFDEVDPTTHEFVFDVWVSTTAGNATPNLYLLGEDQGDTPVATVTTPTAETSSTMTRQQHVITHQGSGQIEVHMLPVLAGGATVASTKMLGRVRIRRIGTT